MYVKLIAVTEDAVNTCEQAAATCYDSQPSEDGRIIKACARSGHLSVWEHMNFTFYIKGISRACLAQLTRHRLMSFSVRSQRYCKENDFGVVLPPSIAHNDQARQLYNNVIDYIRNAYGRMLDLGIPPEDTRFLLPNACETELTVTMNARELMHFCHERLCTRAQWEIRELAGEMAAAAADRVPVIATYLVPKCEINADYPFCPERQGCGRHKKISEVYNDESTDRESSLPPDAL